jgi:hypothetical protein
LDALRQWVGSRSTSDDALLAQCLDVAGSWVRARIYADHWNDAEVQQAVLTAAAKLYRTRQAAEAAGVQGEGLVIRPSTIAGDGNLKALLERHLDMTQVGIA